MAVVPGSADYTRGSVLSWMRQHLSRLFVVTPKRSHGLDPQPSPIQQAARNMGSYGGRSLCHQMFRSTSQVLQLEAGPRCPRHRCLLQTELVRSSQLCTPPMVLGGQSALEGSDRGSYAGADCASVAHTALVPTIVVPPDRLSDTSSQTPGNSHTFSQLRLFSGSRPTPTGRMEGIRERLLAEGISGEATTFIMASWRHKTNANYNSAWRKWESWCLTKSVDPFSAHVSQVLAFLADPFKAGKQCRSLNVYHSALSSVHLPVDGFPVGQHPLVSRLLKGAFNTRLPRLKI